MSGTLEQRLHDIVGARGIVPVEAAEDLLVDERRLYRGRARLVVSPADAGELAAVMACCYEHDVPVVPQGGNTGYCGGATPDESGEQVLLSLARMNDLVGLDRTALTITVQAGATLEQVQQWADERELFFPLAMGSQASCQIGGNLATNAGGLAVLRYGTARELVLGLEVVLPDGRVLSELQGLRKNNTGYPLAQLFCGAEGTLGVITAATLRLYPKPTHWLTFLLAVPELDALAELLLEARRGSGETVTSFEYIARESLEYVMAEFGYSDPLDEPWAHYALIELGTSADGEALAQWMESALEAWMEAGLVRDGVIASNETQRRELWHLREHIPAAERHMGGSIKHDVSVVPSQLPALTAALTAAINGQWPDYRLSIYGHVGDGNLHFNVLAPADSDAPDFVQVQGPAVSRVVHDCTAGFGGSFSAEHGIGRYKAPDLARYADPVRLALMRDIKRALDPKGLMNPGKLFIDDNGSS